MRHYRSLSRIDALDFNNLRGPRVVACYRRHVISVSYAAVSQKTHGAFCGLAAVASKGHHQRKRCTAGTGTGTGTGEPVAIRDGLLQHSAQNQDATQSHAC